MNEPIEICPLTKDTIEGFRHALDSVAQEKQYLLLTEAPPLEETVAFVLNIMKTNGIILVAKRAQHIIGWCDIRRAALAGVWHCGLLGIGLMEGYRNQGIGEQLLRAAITQAQQHDFKRIELSVLSTNLRAYKLYRKLGFVEEGIKHRSVFLEGTYFDLIMMALWLD